MCDMAIVMWSLVSSDATGTDLFFAFRTSRSRHIVPVRKFLENVFEEDLRGYLPEKCFEVTILQCSNKKSLLSHLIC